MSENDRLAEIKARCEAATPGPWDWDVVDDAIMLLGTKGLEAFEGAVLGVRRCEACRTQSPERSPCGWPNQANGDFIAAAREDVPYLLTEVERLRADVARLEGERDRLAKECDALAPCRESLRSLYDVVTRHYDDPGSPWSLGRYDYLLEAAESALGEEPTDAE